MTDDECQHERSILHWDGYRYCIWCNHQWQEEDL